MSKGVDVAPAIYEWNPGNLVSPVPQSELFSYGGYKDRTHYLYIKENCWAYVFHYTNSRGVSSGGSPGGHSYSMDSYWQPLVKGDTIKLISWSSGGSTDWATDSYNYTIYPIKK